MDDGEDRYGERDLFFIIDEANQPPPPINLLDDDFFLVKKVMRREEGIVRLLCNDKMADDFFFGEVIRSEEGHGRFVMQ